jgi:glycosyltransferase involved in cell wall biosynthesis
MTREQVVPPPRDASERPRLSIVMIAYNMERFIGEALDSVLMQAVDFDYEIVIGEDRSTDRTREIVLDYAARHPDRIRPILRDVNLGMNRNFRDTLLQARGHFIALIDSDDYWTRPDKLQKQMDFLRAHPECSICFHNTLVVYENGEHPTHPFHMRQPEYLISHHIPKPVSTLDDLAGGNFMQTCSVMFRADLYGELPSWYLEMPTFDWPLHVLNAQHGDIGYIDEIMGAYRVHAAGFWSMNMALYRTIEDVESMIRGYLVLDRYLGGRYAEKMHAQLLPLYRRAAEVSLMNAHRLRALRYAIKAFPRDAAAHPGGRRQALALAARALTPRRAVAH